MPAPGSVTLRDGRKSGHGCNLAVVTADLLVASVVYWIVAAWLLYLLWEERGCPALD
jgi:hypothetical protein